MSNGTALAKIESARKSGALVFVGNDWFEEKTPLYKAETTELAISKETDCFSISGKFMPKREIVDRIGECSGVDFIFGETKSNTVQDDACGKRTVYTSYAQGRRLMPDGSWRTSSKCDYEFDPVLRAMLDFDVTELTGATKQKRRTTRDGKPYGSTLARYILELQKVAAQRANTGARLRVIRELVGMPVAFDGKDLEKPLLLGRIVQNTDYILQTPEGRAMATAKALGVDIPSLFGGKNAALPEAEAGGQDAGLLSVTPEEAQDAEFVSVTPEAAAERSLFGDRPPQGGAEPSFDDDGGAQNGESEFDRLTGALTGFTEGYRKELDVLSGNGKNPYKLAMAELENKDATEDTRRSMIEKLRVYLQKKGVKA